MFQKSVLPFIIVTCCPRRVTRLLQSDCIKELVGREEGEGVLPSATVLPQQLARDLGASESLRCLRSQQLVAELGPVMKKMNRAKRFEQKSPLKNLEAPTENEALASRDDVTCKAAHAK